MIRYQFTSDWYHFYFHQIYTDFTANNKIKTFIVVASSDAIIYARFLYQWGLVLTVIALVIKRNDKLYNKTIDDYWGIGYDFDIHHWIPILTSSIAMVNIGSLWWIHVSRQIQYRNSK